LYAPEMIESGIGIASVKRVEAIARFLRKGKPMNVLGIADLHESAIENYGARNSGHEARA
jgi:hypothetical protein